MIRPIDRCGCFSFISFAAVSTPPVVALRAKTSASPAPPVTAPKRDERSRSPEYTGKKAEV